MKILILGGTGAIGIHLVSLLSNTNNKVYVTTRKERISTNKTNYIIGDAQNQDFIEELLKDFWDVIVDFMIYDTNVFKDRVELFLKNTNHYFFLSSSRVHSNSDSKITENTPRLLDNSTDSEYLNTDEYALKKARQENILFESNFKNWTIVRPYITFSENRFQLGVLEKEEWLYRALKGRKIVFSEEISSKYTTLTYGFDLGACIAQLILNSKSKGEVFNITSSHSIKWEDVLKIYLNVLENHLGVRPKVILQDTTTFLTWKRSKYQVIYDRLFNRKFDNKKILDYTKDFEFSEIEKSLEKSLITFLKKPSFKYLYIEQEALKDKYTKQRTPLREFKGIKNKLKYFYYRNIKN